MNLLTRIGSAWSALTKSPPPGGYGAGWGGGPFWADYGRSRRAPTPYELIEAYRAIAYACVNLNANGVANTRLRLYITTNGGQPRPKSWVGTKPLGCTAYSRQKAWHRLRSLGYATKAMAQADEIEEVTEHPLLDAVMKVNEDLDHIQLLLYTVMSLDIVGSAYWWPSLGSYRVPAEIWALPPHLVSPIMTSGAMVPESYTFGGVTYPKADLIRFRRLSARNPYGVGYSPEQAGIEYVRLEEAMVSMQDNVLTNGPRPSVVLSLKDDKGGFGSSERTRVEHVLNSKTRGGRSGSALVVDAAVDVKPLSYDKVDTGIQQLSDSDRERIANCFDVPVSMLKTEDVNRANSEAGQRQHARNGVEPRCKLIASTLTRWTHAQDPTDKRGWHRLVWAFDNPVGEDRIEEADLQTKRFSMAALSPNEIRAENGYDPIEGGDTLFVPSGLQTLEAALKPPEPAPAPGQKPGQSEPDETANPDEAEPEDDAEATKALLADARRLTPHLRRIKAMVERSQR